jgi:hypothetical protein
MKRLIVLLVVFGLSGCSPYLADEYYSATQRAQPAKPRYLQAIEPDGCSVWEYNGTWNCDDEAREQWLDENAVLTQEEMAIYNSGKIQNQDQKKIAYAVSRVYDCSMRLISAEESVISCTPH